MKFTKEEYFDLLSRAYENKDFYLVSYLVNVYRFKAPFHSNLQVVDNRTMNLLIYDYDGPEMRGHTITKELREAWGNALVVQLGPDFYEWMNEE